MVNGKEARSRSADFAEWESTLDAPADGRLTARAVDRSGNEEPRAQEGYTKEEIAGKLGYALR
jgi:hypothetical protein